MSNLYTHAFEKLNVWQESIELVEKIYHLTSSFPDSEKFGLTNQMRRSAVSISSNLAEGSARITNKDKAHFSTLSFSSAMELLNQLIIAKRLTFISEDEFSDIRELIMKVSNMLNSLRKSQLK